MAKDNFTEFMGQIFRANKEYVLEKWVEWEKYLADTLKATVEEAYPEGFKSFLVERLDADIKKHSSKNGKAKKAEQG